MKQIYVSIQIDSGYIKILVAEYFNSRFNILKYSSKKSKACDCYEIVDYDLLVSDIKDLVDSTSKAIGAKIEKVLLLLPEYNFKRFPLKSSIVLNEGYVKLEDISRAITNSLRSKVDDDVMVINAVPVKYSINGISTRRIPENEVGSNMDVDIDLLCADKQMSYQFVKAIEDAGLEVVDVCLNNYGILKEAGLVNESAQKNTILIDINYASTTMSLVSKGKLITTEILHEGLNSFINKVYYTHHIPYDDIEKLIKYLKLDFESEDIVYAFSSDNKSFNIKINELSLTISECINTYVDKIITLCKPILEDNNVNIYVVGVGEEMNSLVDAIKDKSSVEVKAYYPDTIGVRDSSVTGLFGALFDYKDKVALHNLNTSFIDLLEYDSVIDQKNIDSDGDTITTKIKNFFMQYMNKEDK